MDGLLPARYARLRFAANLSTLFTGLPLAQRFAAARAAGFGAVECQFPYALAASELADLLHDNALELVLFNLPPGDFDKGERGIACHPDRVGEFQDGVGRALEYAAASNCKQLNILAGIAPEGVAAERLRAVLVANLRFAAGQLAAAGVAAVVEPINSYDIPGFYLNRSAQTIGIMDEVGSDNLKLQYDIYHMQRMEGELAATMAKLLPRIGHIQIADNPGRGAPGTGEINFPFLFAHLAHSGYRGWIGCEYLAESPKAASFGWMAP